MPAPPRAGIGAPKAEVNSWGEQVVKGILKNDLAAVQQAFISDPKADINAQARNWGKSFYGGYYFKATKDFIEGDTAFHLAVKKDCLEIIRFMLTLYPRPRLDIKNKNGKIALDYVASDSTRQLLTLADF
ncbi:hypothetical protein CYMTET_41566 [Cymbomonas tetramitiformis]|uniref:Ankyrin repeat domain-containing protein n=1 Tax=Cymbomonas tetramitiformis TaxID=36881 RepID=A0AAE0C800_9CHLO|nr:hypothetical protein CYMTET_41566 [Cymbomonas tetramitiformis]